MQLLEEEEHLDCKSFLSESLHVQKINPSVLFHVKLLNLLIRSINLHSIKKRNRDRSFVQNFQRR